MARNSILNINNRLGIRRQFSQIPKKLIYRSDSIIAEDNIIKSTEFRMYDTELGKYVGKMLCSAKKLRKHSRIYPEETKNFYAYEIDLLLIEEKRRGYGTDFIEIAKRESYRQNCGGKLFLFACPTFDPEYPCPIFYKKKGLVSTFEKTNKVLDYCIKTNTELPQEYRTSMTMYLPITHKKQPQQTIKSRLINYIKKFFNKK